MRTNSIVGATDGARKQGALIDPVRVRCGFDAFLAVSLWLTNRTANIFTHEAAQPPVWSLSDWYGKPKAGRPRLCSARFLSRKSQPKVATGKLRLLSSLNS